jgi:hypothetical protein
MEFGPSRMANRIVRLATFNDRRRRLRRLRREQLAQPERILVWTVFKRFSAVPPPGVEPGFTA